LTEKIAFFTVCFSSQKTKTFTNFFLLFFKNVKKMHNGIFSRAKKWEVEDPLNSAYLAKRDG